MLSRVKRYALYKYYILRLFSLFSVTLLLCYFVTLIMLCYFVTLFLWKYFVTLEISDVFFTNFRKNTIAIEKSRKKDEKN